MGLFPFFFGLVVGFFPVLYFLRLSRGKFFIITNAYFAGVLYGFWLWVLLMLVVFLDLRYDLVGFASSEQGVGLISILSSSVRGFILGGLAAALVWKKIFRN